MLLELTEVEKTNTTHYTIYSQCLVLLHPQLPIQPKPSRAMIMLGTYYYFKGRLLEGHVCISQATRFAVALGIHQLNSRIYRDKKPNEIKGVFGTERWCPRDSIELGEAINVWW